LSQHISETPNLIANKHRKLAGIIPLQDKSFGILRKIKKKQTDGQET